MIIRGKNIGKKSATVSINSKVFIELINNIEESDLLAMDSIELLTIINQGILPNNNSTRDILTTEPFSDKRKAVLKGIKDAVDNGEDITKSTYDNDEIPEDKEEDEDKPTTSIANEKKKDLTKDNSKEEEENKKLAKLHIVRSLKTIDNPLVNAISDGEAIEVLITNKMRKLWESIINKILTIDDVFKEFEECGKYSKIVFERFIEEYKDVIGYRVPNGFEYKIKKNGKIIVAEPNLMQKLMVHRVKKNHWYGNWSGMGSGKTLSAIISSREVKSHLTIVVCVNSTKEQWHDDILNAFPESTGTHIEIADSSKYDEINFDMSKYNYLIIPYSRFSQVNEEPHLKHIADNKVDFIIIDEVHKAKKRGEETDESARRERLVKLINWSREINKNMYGMAMSGTPVINELSEAKSLLSLLTNNKFDDIKTNRTLSNALKLHQMLLIHGLRFVPKYDKELLILTSDNDSSLKINGDKYLENLKGAKSISAEKMFVTDKLNAIEHFLKKGVLIYTHYTTDFIQPIRSFVESKGFSTALYSDNRENRDEELKRFRNGIADIMVASDPVTTGVDRLQEVCDTMILITLPWTNADFEQLKGRIYRQGMNEDSTIRVIIPQVIVHDAEGKEWSWDKQRYDVIKYKKTLADCVIDGVIPQMQFYTRETLYRKSIEALKTWKERINSDDILVRQDSGMTVNLEVVTQEEHKARIKSIISDFNRRGKTTNSKRLHKEITENPEEWYEYHKARHENMKTWDEIPYEYIASNIKNKNRIVADFGCGENLMKTFIPNNKVYSFDHIAIDDSVIACDMANTPLENESIDIAVFSLALWGTNFEDYFKEAYRLLNYDGLMYIAEPSKTYTKEGRDKLLDILRRNGFTLVGDIEDRGKFFYIKVIKK